MTLGATSAVAARLIDAAPTTIERLVSLNFLCTNPPCRWDDGNCAG
jgi:hypothetical protein